MRKFVNTIAGIALSSAMLAACSAGAGSGSPGGTVVPSRVRAKWTGKIGHMKIRLHVPSAQRRQHDSRRAKPNFLPTSVATVAFTLVAINGTTNTDPSYNFTIATSSCTPEPTVSPTGYLCAAIEPAPVGSDQWTIVASDSSATPKTLSEANVVTVVTATDASPTSFTLDAVVAGLSWTTVDFPNGIDTPKWTGSTYTCVNPPDGGCFDPLLNVQNTAAADGAVLNVLDSDGNVVIPTSASTVSGAPYAPIYFTGTGAEDHLSVTCDDPDVEWLNASATVPIALASLTTGDLANGFSNANWSAAVASFNSPVTGQDTATAGQGTDFFGNPIPDGFYGNNGGFMNYDGTSSGSYGNLGVIDTCTASDTQGLQATYSIGLTEGSIGWGSNAKQHRSKGAR